MSGPSPEGPLASAVQRGARARNRQRSMSQAPRSGAGRAKVRPGGISSWYQAAGPPRSRAANGEIEAGASGGPGSIAADILRGCPPIDSPCACRSKIGGYGPYGVLNQSHCASITRGIFAGAPDRIERRRPYGRRAAKGNIRQLLGIVRADRRPCLHGIAPCPLHALAWESFWPCSPRLRSARLDAAFATPWMSRESRAMPPTAPR